MTALTSSVPYAARLTVDYSERLSSSSIVDVLVIGAGQAGLAVGYHLRAAGARRGFE